MTADLLAPLLARRERLAADLAELDAAIGTLRRLFGGEPAAEASPGKPVPRPARAAGAGRALPAGQVSRDDRAMQVARLLASAGPLKSEEIGGRLGCAAVVAKWAIDHRPDWFRKVGGNRLSPWELTEAGRALATDPTATRNGVPH